MRLYRVFPYDAAAAPTDRGGALFVPPSSGLGRIDNPGLYDVLYVATAPHAAIAETFGRLALWRANTFVHAGGMPYGVATYEARDDLPIFDLNDVDALRSIGITRPTEVVTRDRTVTQAWARAIFELSKHSGASWWSFYDPDWPVMGLWDLTAFRLAGVDIITSTDVLVRETASAIVRQVAP